MSPTGWRWSVSYNTLIAVQRETLDNLHEGIVVFGENGRLTCANPMFHKLWQLLPEFTASEPHIRAVLERCKQLSSPTTGKNSWKTWWRVSSSASSSPCVSSVRTVA